MAAIGKRQDLENVLVLMNPPLIIIGLEQIFIWWYISKGYKGIDRLTKINFEVYV